jgi:hypothetical protein
MYMEFTTWLPGHPIARPLLFAAASVMSIRVEVLTYWKPVALQVAVHFSTHTSARHGTTCVDVLYADTFTMFISV